MAHTPKVTIVIPQTLLNHFKTQAIREERSLSATIVRTLRIASGLPLDPEAGSKEKTPELPLK